MHYNAGRPHKLLGPVVPGPSPVASLVPKSQSRHLLPAGTIVHAKSVLAGLHHDYSLALAHVLDCCEQGLNGGNYEQ